MFSPGESCPDNNGNTWDDPDISAKMPAPPHADPFHFHPLRHDVRNLKFGINRQKGRQKWLHYNQPDGNAGKYYL